MSNSLVARIARRYRAEGLVGLAAAVGNRVRQRLEPARRAWPVAWARFGPASLWLARRIPPAAPPVLILGHPRSGTSWVGSTLGRAANALFLHEPVDQTMIANGVKLAVYWIDAANPPPAELGVAERAFAALPNFPPAIVRFPEQWRLSERRRRRLVIKEVNLLACEFFLRRYRPRVVLLVRHPAAVALSHKKLGWWGSHTSWRAHAAHQGKALRQALDSLEAYGNYRVVLYEALCADPAAIFRELFEFSGLEWTSEVAALVQLQSSVEKDADSPWSLWHMSRSMIRAWASQMTPAEAAEVRAGYCTYALPWYASDEDW